MKYSRINLTVSSLKLLFFCLSSTVLNILHSRTILTLSRFFNLLLWFYNFLFTLPPLFIPFWVFCYMFFTSFWYFFRINYFISIITGELKPEMNRTFKERYWKFMTVPKHNLLLFATTFLLVVLFLSAAVLLYRISVVQHKYTLALQVHCLSCIYLI